LEIRDFFGVLRKYMWIIVVTIVLVLSLSIFLAMRQKEMFEAKSQLVVNTERGFGSRFDELPVVTELVSMEANRNVTTQVEILRSNKVINRTAKELGLTPEQRKEIEINVHPVEDSDVITIIVKAPRKGVAINMANELPRQYLEYSVEARKEEAMQSARYLQQEKDKVRKQLEEAEEALKNFKDTKNIKDLGQETQKKVSELIDFESKMEDTRVELEATRAKIHEIKAQLDEKGDQAIEQERIASRTVEANPTVRHLTQALAQLEVEHARLSQIYEERHPKVLEVTAQIQEIKEQLRGLEVKTFTSVVTAPNPQYELLVKTLASLRADERALETKYHSFKDVVNNIDRSLSELPDEEIKLIRLERNHKLLENLYTALNIKFQDFNTAEKTKKAPGRIIEEAYDAISRARTTKIFTIALGLMMGLLLGMVVAFTLEYFNDTIETPEQLEQSLHMSVLGQLLFDDAVTEAEILCAEKPNTPIAESFRALRSRLKHALGEREAKSLLVTSTAVQEGKSFVALNLAVTFAQFGKNVILVDGDLRRPTIHKKFKVENKGCTNVYVDKMDYRELILETEISNLSILPSGPLVLTENTPVISSEIFESDIMKNMMMELRQTYDVVVVDTPPVMAVTDSLIISSLVEGILFVVSAGELPSKEIVQAKNILESASAPLLGSVLNRTQFTHSYYRYLYYYYDTQTGERRRHRS